MRSRFSLLPASELSHRVFGLDLLRALAILLVVLGHTRWITEPFPVPLKIALQGSGILGVELFFVLSGFLIGRILLVTFEQNGYQLKFSDVTTFWVRRWFRTVPAYVLVLLVFIVVYHHELPTTLGLYFVFFQNYAWQSPYFFNESWTLTLEEHTYLIAPVVLFAVASIRVARPQRRTFLYVALGLIGFFTLIRLAYSLTGQVEEWDDVRKVVVFRLDSIFYGFVGAYLARYHADRWHRYRWPLLVLGSVLVLLPLVHYRTYLKYARPDVWESTFVTSGIGLSVLCLLPFFSSLKQIRWKGLSRAVTLVSVTSYAMYLVNDKLLSRLFENFFQPLPVSFGFALGVYVLYWITLLSLSYVMYRYFEKPMTNLRDFRWSSKKRLV
jgi:peptidoglycan/LPS O-acetylase OafA/YrhL